MRTWSSAAYPAMDRLDSLALLQVADRLEHSVSAFLDEGYRTGDLMSPGMKQVGCTEAGDLLLRHIGQPVGASA